MITRHPLLKKSRNILILLTFLMAQIHPADAVTPSGSRLKTLADANDLWFGSALNEYGFWTPDSVTYLDLLGSEANMLTPEGAMKFAGIHPSQNVFSYESGDRVVNFAESKSAAVHGHTLLWYYGNPSWVETGTWTAATLTDVMYNHIDSVVGHWQGRIAVWDVVNEAIDGTKSSTDWTQNLRYTQDIWNRVIGPTYIEKAFIRAHAADPTAILSYNDYDVEGINAKSNTMYAMMVDFKNRGIPVDSVGLQCHFMALTPDYTSLAANLDRFAKLGLLIYITEFDTSNPSGSLGTVPSPANDAQARIYYNAMDKFLRCPAIMGVQTWGLTDKYSWLGANKFPLPFDSNYVAKPAYYALQDAFANQRRQELAVNGRLETGALSPWVAKGGGAVALSTTAPHSGTYALSVTSRTVDVQGPAQTVTSQLIAQGSGRFYLSGWAKFAAGSGTVRAVLDLTDGNGTHRYTFNKVVGPTWTPVTGSFNVTWFKTLTQATLSFETPGYLTNFEVDDVRLGDGDILTNSTFENGITGWVGTGGTILSATTASALYHYGAGGLACTNRVYSGDVPKQDILSALLAQGPGAYNFEAYLKLASGTGTGKVTLKLTYGGVSYYISGATGAINSTAWTKVSSSAPVNVTWTGSLTSAILYVETPGTTGNFYMDDIWMKK